MKRVRDRFSGALLIWRYCLVYRAESPLKAHRYLYPSGHLSLHEGQRICLDKTGKTLFSKAWDFVSFPVCDNEDIDGSKDQSGTVNLILYTKSLAPNAWTCRAVFPIP